MSAAVELYRIEFDGAIYTLTSGRGSYVFDSGSGDETYEPTVIGRGGGSVKSDVAKSNMEVRLTYDHVLADNLLLQWVESLMLLTIYTVRRTGVEVTWKGRLAAIEPQDKHVKLVFESNYSSLREAGLRGRYQKNCRHALYARGCFLNKASFAAGGTLSSITGRVLVVPEADSQPDGYYSGGMIAAPDGTLSYITAHSGSSLTLSRVSAAMTAAFASAGAGMAVTLYPGCDHSYSTCSGRFNNDENYGGFDYIPTKNPMAGSSIV